MITNKNWRKIYFKNRKYSYKIREKSATVVSQRQRPSLPTRILRKPRLGACACEQREQGDGDDAVEDERERGVREGWLGRVREGWLGRVRVRSRSCRRVGVPSGREFDWARVLPSQVPLHSGQVHRDVQAWSQRELRHCKRNTLFSFSF